MLPDGEVHKPEVYRRASRKDLEALERWAKLCGEPLDHLDAAEELLDRMGDAYGWRSREAFDAALLRERLELPCANPWLVEKTAQAVVSFYAELAEHGSQQPRHPALRGAVRRLERLREIEYVAAGRLGTLDAARRTSRVGGRRGGGWHVNDLSKVGNLVCEECGLKTALDGPLSAYSSGGTAFGCRCGEDGNPNAAVPLRQERQERPASV